AFARAASRGGAPAVDQSAAVGSRGDPGPLRASSRPRVEQRAARPHPSGPVFAAFRPAEQDQRPAFPRERDRRKDRRNCRRCGGLDEYNCTNAFPLERESVHPSAAMSESSNNGQDQQPQQPQGVKPAPPPGVKKAAGPPGVKKPSGPPAGTKPAGPPSGTKPTGPPSGVKPAGPPSGVKPAGPPSVKKPAAPSSGTKPAGPPTARKPAGPPTAKKPAGPGAARKPALPPTPGGDGAPAPLTRKDFASDQDV